MNLNRLSAGIFTSVIVLGSLGVVAVNSQSVNAQAINNIRQELARKEVIASGSFVTVDRGHPTSGNARIVSENGQRYLEFDQRFRTVGGPDVRVILSRTQVVPVNVNEQDYITLAPLESVNGTQRYVIPANVNLDEFPSVAIWCRQFNVTFGYAAF